MRSRCRKAPRCSPREWSRSLPSGWHASLHQPADLDLFSGPNVDDGVALGQDALVYANVGQLAILAVLQLESKRNHKDHVGIAAQGDDRFVPFPYPVPRWSHQPDRAAAGSHRQGAAEPLCFYRRIP